jgi:glycosyltransferase involved in cell wall biosynthesis
VTSPVRVLYVCHDGELYGSQRSLLQILRHLPAEWFKPYISVARPGPLNQALQSLPQVVELRHDRLQWVKHDPRTLVQQIGDIAGLLFNAIPRTLVLYRHIQHHRIQIVHTNSVVSPEGALAALLAGVPHVWHIREMFMEENPKLHMVLGRKITRWVIDRLSSRVISISDAVQEQFLPYLSGDIKYPVIYNALAPEGIPSDNPPPEDSQSDIPPKEEGRYRIGYVGRLSQGKRFHDLLDAFYLLVQHDLPVELVVAGNFVDEPYEAFIKQKVQDLGLTEMVRFLGFLPDPFPLYKTLDVLAVPSLNEPFGRVVIEAMWMNVPCVAANSGGIPEIIEHDVTGLLYTPKDLAALARQIRELLENEEHRTRLVEQARRMVDENFTIEKQLRALENCYWMLLEMDNPRTGKAYG